MQTIHENNENVATGRGDMGYDQLGVCVSKKGYATIDGKSLWNNYETLDLRVP